MSTGCKTLKQPFIPKINCLIPKIIENDKSSPTFIIVLNDDKVSCDISFQRTTKRKSKVFHSVVFLPLH